MPPLTSSFTRFEKVNRTRLTIIEAKERAAGTLAAALLPERPALSKATKLARSVTRIVTGRSPTMPMRESKVAVYDVETGRGVQTFAAFVNEHALFVGEVIGHDDTGTPQVRGWQLRAALNWGNCPVLAFEESGHEAFPDLMTLDDREAFIDDVQETLTIIGCQAEGPTFREVARSISFAG